MAEPGGAYCAAFSSRCASAVAVSRGSSRTGTSGSTVHVQRVRLQRVLHLVARRRDDLRRMRPSRLGGDRAGIDPRHLEDVLEQPRQPFDFGQNQVALLQPLVGGQRRRLDVGRGDANRRERRAQIVAERRQQRRLQLLALPRQLARLALLEKLRALDRDRHDAAERVERAGFDRPAGGREQADRLGADPQRHEPDRRGRRPSIVRWPA